MKKSLLNNKQYKIFKTILGLLLIQISIILFISFISYLININNINVQNALGKIGDIISTSLLYNGIGISILLLPIILFFLGLKIIFYIKNINIKKLILHILFFIYWMPMMLTLLFSNPIIYGNLILKIKYVLIYFIGKIGIILLLLTTKIIYIILVFNITLDQLFLKKNRHFFFNYF